MDSVTSCDDPNFSSSYVESVHDSDIRNDFKVFVDLLYDDEFDVDQHITCHNTYKGSLYGIINSLFEEHMECLDLVEDEFNDDTFSYYSERSNCSTFECDSENDDVASDEIDNKVFDEVVIENLSAHCNEFYDEYSNMMDNPFSNFKEPSEVSRLISHSNIDDICEYKYDC